MSGRRAFAGALLALLCGWLVAGVVTAGPASAHAALVSSTPADGARLDSSPRRIDLQFTEHVTIGPGYARVLDSGGHPVDTGAPAVHGDVVSIPLRQKLATGGYVVTYRIISADSHPVSGAYAFAVGNGPLLSAQAIRPTTSTDPGIAALLPVSRWIGFAGLSLALGIPAFALACWPAGWGSRRLRLLATRGALAVTVGAVLEFLLQGPYTAGSGLGSLVDPALLATTAGSAPGAAMLIRAVLGLAMVPLLGAAFSRGTPPQWAAAVGAILGLGLVVSTAAVGHAVAGPWVWGALPSTAVHVAAMTVWLGGLVGLLGAVLRRDAAVADVAAAVPRFSRLAFGAVSALVVTGVVQTVREVPTPGALFTTEYGQLLVAKICAVVVVLGAAAVSRVWVQQHLGVGGRRPDGRRRVTAHAFAAEEEEEKAAAAVGLAGAGGAGVGLPRRVRASAAADLPSLRRSVLVELALALAILAVTAVLVGESPVAAAPAQPIDVTKPLVGTAGTSGTVEISVAPASPGVNSLHLYLLDAQRQPTQPAGIRVTLANRARSIGPIDVLLTPSGPGHYTADAMQIPGAGDWTLTVIVREDEFTAVTASTTFPVR